MYGWTVYTGGLCSYRGGCLSGGLYVQVDSVYKWTLFYIDSLCVQVVSICTKVEPVYRWFLCTASFSDVLKDALCTCVNFDIHTYMCIERDLSQ